MANYDFHPLSPLDFELLCRDVLQADLGIRFESFASGRDKGIDFRHAPSKDSSTILQCKHYLKSPSDRLLRDLRDKELPKIAKLAPKRYIVCTSQELTPERKNKIVAVLAPYISSPADIFGRDDLNNLLAAYPATERQHFKLWITSTGVLETVLHGRTVNLTEQTLLRVKLHAPRFVQHEGFARALQILEQHHTCIIAGIPGIGKTTLAEMLFLYHIESGFDLVVINNDISEAHALPKSQRPRIFYYDDFLGQTALGDKLQKNEDQQLLDFISSLRHGPDRLILTTREYILNQSRLRYEKLYRANLTLNTCVLDLVMYTRAHRADILFNHLYFAKLTRPYIDCLLKDREFLKIIDHPNYNPRVIELMTAPERVTTISPPEYVKQFLATLKNPAEIWEHIFDQQLSTPARHALLVLRTLTSDIQLEIMEKAFLEFHNYNSHLYRQAVSAGDFKNALKELDGSFILTEKSRNRTVVRFHNPSVRDFLTGYLLHSADEVKALLKTAVFFDQLWMLWYLPLGGTDSANYHRVLMKDCDLLFAAARKVLHAPPSRLAKYSDGRETYFGPDEDPFEDRAYFILNLAIETEGHHDGGLLTEALLTVEQRIDKGEADREGVVDLVKTMWGQRIYANRKRYDDEVQNLLPKVKAFLVTDPDSLEGYEPVADLLDEFPDLLDELERDELIHKIRRRAGEIRFEWEDSGLLHSQAEALQTIGKRLKVDFTRDIERLREYAYQHEPEELPVEKPATQETVTVTDEDIAGLFGLLK